MSMELSEVDTEYILEHFKDLKDGPFADLTSALRDLSRLPEVLAPANPPLMPSQVIKNVKPFKRSTGRNISTVIVATAIAVSTTLAAAALTGVGPKPLVEFAKSTIKVIRFFESGINAIVSSPSTIAEKTAPHPDAVLPTPQSTPNPPENAESNNAEKLATTKPNVQSTQEEAAKVEEKKIQNPTEVEKHPILVTPTPEVEPSAQSFEKTELKPTEVAETSAPEKEKTKAPVEAKSETTRNTAPMPVVSEKPSVQSSDSKGVTEYKDD